MLHHSTYGAQIGNYPINNALEVSILHGELDQPLPVNNIANNQSFTEGNIFCFGVFAEKHTGAVYNDLTGYFPFMSLEGNICFLILYCYKLNTILGMPIAKMEDATIFATYRH
jgi:hypothetical protein